MREKLPPLLLSLSASYLFGLGVALWAFDLSPWLNFSIGFFGSLLVMVATFLSHYRRVLEASKEEELVALEDSKSGHPPRGDSPWRGFGWERGSRSRSIAF
jgi:hypothetical protein